MGRSKIEIKRLEPASHRNSTFKKRFKGLSKKAEEISVLCDVPALLLVTEPTNKQTLCVTGNRTFEQIVQQFANESKESLRKENKGCIELHKRAYKDDHVVDVRSLMHNGIRQAKGGETFERKEPLEMIEEEIAKIEDQLSPLRGIGGLEKINTIDQLEAFEKYLTELFSLNERKKALLLEKQKNGHHHLPMPYEGDFPVSTSPLVHQTGGLSEVLLREQQTSTCHVPSHFEGYPMCSTSTAALSVVPTAPFPSDATTPLYHSNATASVQPSGPMNINGGQFEGLRNLSYGDPRCSPRTAAAPVAPLYGRNMIETANVSVFASSPNPQNGDFPEEAGPEEYMQSKYDEEISSIVNLHLQSPNHEDYSFFF